MKAAHSVLAVEKRGLASTRGSSTGGTGSDVGVSRAGRAAVAAKVVIVEEAVGVAGTETLQTSIKEDRIRGEKDSRYSWPDW